MAKRKRKPTAAQQAYNKEVKRIKQFIRRAENRGYMFEDDLLPKRPKKITEASVRRLKKITPDKLYKKSEVVLEETGEIIKGTEARKIERKFAAEKAARTRQNKKAEKVATPAPPNISDIIIANFLNYIVGFPAIISQPILSWFAALRLRYTDNQVAIMLESSEIAGVKLADYLNRPGYDSDGAARDYCAALIDFLPEGGEGIDRLAINDAFEEDSYNPFEDGDEW